MSTKRSTNHLMNEVHPQYSITYSLRCRPAPRSRGTLQVRTMLASEHHFSMMKVRFESEEVLTYRPDSPTQSRHSTTQFGTV